jgi:TRAP-type uncharacterized transport system substrate-binding protein
MIERKLTRLIALGAAAAALCGHSPYRQWYAYRAKHLVVVAAESRPGAMELATAVASAIAARWPETKAVPAAARTTTEVVKLLRSGQLQVALLPPADALEALQGRDRFADDAKVPLRVVAVLGSDLLVVLEDYPRERARRIAQALAEHEGPWPLAARPALRSPAPLPFHPGALDYFDGKAPKKG